MLLLFFLSLLPLLLVPLALPKEVVLVVVLLLTVVPPPGSTRPLPPRSKKLEAPPTSAESWLPIWLPSHGCCLASVGLLRKEGAGNSRTGAQRNDFEWIDFLAGPSGLLHYSLSVCMSI